MPEQRNDFEALLASVEKPGRYTGGEWNAVRKDPARAEVRVALAFPDVYEIGMSYLGQKVLYDTLNARPGCLAERVFAPWPDLEAGLRARRIPLATLENRIPLGECDIVGFSLLYELNYSNVLTMLDLAGIPFRSADRTLLRPLIIAGGPAAFNPEPVAEIFDLFLVGDGEEAFPEIVERVAELKRRGAGKEDALRDLAGIRGVYIPAFYETWSPDGSPLQAVRPRSGVSATVRKRVLTAYARAPFPVDIVVPNVQSVFDRVAIEVARGCPQKCRFCQATSLYAPYRVRDPDAVVETVLRSVSRTGYEDASLFSLSVGDYPYLDETVETLMAALEKDRVSLSLSALRPKGLSGRVAREITKVRKTGFTLVPEAGTDRLRRVINKCLEEKDILEAAANAYREGWRLLKLYFMIGLPTETIEDVEAIVGLAERLTFLGREVSGGAPRINLSVSSFIPKPHTPFQWAAMDDEEVLVEKQALLRTRLARRRNVQVKDHPLESSLLEAVFARGDRRLTPVLERAWRKGARFDSWTDAFRFEAWREAFEEEGLDPRVYLGRIDTAAVLPWDHIETGVPKAFLVREFERALGGEPTPSCLEAKCGACRGCDFPADADRVFSKRLETREIPGPVPLGLPSAEPVRGQAFYVKEGPLRFVGHNDLVNVIQRTFRRAGVPAAYSEGFHPKMRIVLIPPLALGMEGRDESLEVRLTAEVGEGEFLAATNGAAPAGLRFTRFARLPASARPLNDRIRGMEYVLDLGADEVRAALDARRTERGWAGLSDPDVARRLIETDVPDPGRSGPKIVLEAEGRRIVLSFVFDPQKAPRPQETVIRLLGLSHPAHSIVRESVHLDPA